MPGSGISAQLKQKPKRRPGPPLSDLFPDNLHFSGHDNTTNISTSTTTLKTTSDATQKTVTTQAQVKPAEGALRFNRSTAIQTLNTEYVLEVLSALALIQLRLFEKLCRLRAEVDEALLKDAFASVGAYTGTQTRDVGESKSTPAQDDRILRRRLAYFQSSLPEPMVKAVLSNPPSPNPSPSPSGKRGREEGPEIAERRWQQNGSRERRRRYDLSVAHAHMQEVRPILRGLHVVCEDLAFAVRRGMLGDRKDFYLPRLPEASTLEADLADCKELVRVVAGYRDLKLLILKRVEALPSQIIASKLADAAAMLWELHVDRFEDLDVDRD